MFIYLAPIVFSSVMAQETQTLPAVPAVPALPGTPSVVIYMPNGPKCEMVGLKSVDQSKCQEFATKLGYIGAALQAGSWGHAPLGCFIGHPADNWSHLYYNSQSGQTGRDVYRTLCNAVGMTATDKAEVRAVAADPAISIFVPNGPKCELVGLVSVEQTKCQEYATKLGYNGTALQAGSWGHAPVGCFIGHPADNWSHLYYNSQSGQTGRDMYRTVCNVMETTATDKAGVPAVAADPAISMFLPNGPKCELVGLVSVEQTKCQEYATKLEYNGTALQAGSWGHAPFGCFIGHLADNWSHLYYNSQSGQTGRDIYRTLCNLPAAAAA